ncbi:hypothetical protein L1276_001781 [Flavobacterium sp. HSC-32F16]|uniref:T9SS type A sorting domain-containing protein n=1 Tax=Flavobacterium sp. HSC-32F16 TaxID=2910964 RepID=UPI0020A2D99C|nr:T9SS type A sorting domain-containing protein [Flavobacterium sp. HSC-32F16]MCP2026637.1 hypothetical protein [Flavobacterium sp. HSC-32F16]
MKKTLLCFLFLFTNLFYAQVNNIEHCFGDTYFDLTVNNSLLLGNLNPAETIISFHLSQDDATNNVNAILQPTYYNNSASSKTIYARIDNNGTITTNYFDLKIYGQLSITPLTTPVNCNGMNNGHITVIPSGGKAPYAYQINGGPYTVYNDGLNPLQLHNLAAGIYVIQAKDALGCASAIYPVQIEQPSLLNANVIIDNQNTIIVTASGGKPQYEYSLNGLDYQKNQYFANLLPGTYNVTVRDANHCTFQTTPIVIYPPLTAAAQSEPVTCNHLGMITVIVAGGNPSYVYSINGSNFSPINVFHDLPAGNYVIRVRDGKNNEITIPVVVSTINPPTFTFELRNAVCKGSNDGSIKLSASGGGGQYSYSLDLVNFQPGNTFNNLAAGTYTAVVKDYYGCTSYPLNFTITEPEILTSTVAVNNQTITVTAGGGTGSYQYSADLVNYQDSNVFENLPKGTYKIYVKDSNGCIISKSDINIEPLIAQATTTMVSCVPGIITVTASGGSGSYEYSFDNGRTFTNSNIYSTTSIGGYVIIVRDSQNNTANTYVEVQQTPSLVIISEQQNIRCKGENTGVIIVKASGGQPSYSYSINGGPFAALDSFYNLSAGTYSIIARDTAGCEIRIVVTISEPVAPLVSNIIVEDQTIKIESHGGTGQVLYSISPNLDQFSVNTTYSNLAAGDYQIIAQDANGCFNLFNVVIEAPAPLIDGKKEIVFEFKSGQTLEDIIVDGQNIKWYSSKGTSSNKTGKKTVEPTLPLTTVLVDGVTYYASQTVDGIESKERLAVTAKVNGSLSTDDFVLPNFKYYPNPVQHVLNISNSSNIDDVEVISVSGKSILTKQINNTHSEIDLSNVSSGLYFLKVKSEGQTKTIKIVKK